MWGWHGNEQVGRRGRAPWYGARAGLSAAHGGWGAAVRLRQQLPGLQATLRPRASRCAAPRCRPPSPRRWRATFPKCNKYWSRPLRSWVGLPLPLLACRWAGMGAAAAAVGGRGWRGGWRWARAGGRWWVAGARANASLTLRPGNGCCPVLLHQRCCRGGAATHADLAAPAHRYVLAAPLLMQLFRLLLAAAALLAQLCDTCLLLLPCWHSSQTRAKCWRRCTSRTPATCCRGWRRATLRCPTSQRTAWPARWAHVPGLSACLLLTALVSVMFGVLKFLLPGWPAAGRQGVELRARSCINGCISAGGGCPALPVYTCGRPALATSCAFPSPAD